MGKPELHHEKYEMFLADAMNESVSHPMRTEAYFLAAFHLIESVAAGHSLHVQKHQHLRRFLEANLELFGDDTETVWKNFQTIENQIRPGQMYGSKVNGKQLERARQCFETIQVCVEKAAS